MGKVNYTPEQENEIISLAQQGYTPTQIALIMMDKFPELAQYNLTGSHINGWLRTRNIPVNTAQKSVITGISGQPSPPPLLGRKRIGLSIGDDKSVETPPIDPVGLVEAGKTAYKEGVLDAAQQQEHLQRASKEAVETVLTAATKKDNKDKDETANAVLIALSNALSSGKNSGTDLKELMILMAQQNQQLLTTINAAAQSQIDKMNQEHKNEMERTRQFFEQQMRILELRHKEEREREKIFYEEQKRREEEFLAKLKELDDTRQEILDEKISKAEELLESKRKTTEELIEKEKQHAEEVIALRQEILSAASKDKGDKWMDFLTNAFNRGLTTFQDALSKRKAESIQQTGTLASIIPTGDSPALPQGVLGGSQQPSLGDEEMLRMLGIGVDKLIPSELKSTVSGFMENLAMRAEQKIDGECLLDAEDTAADLMTIAQSHPVGMMIVRNVCLYPMSKIITFLTKGKIIDSELAKKLETKEVAEHWEQARMLFFKAYKQMKQYIKSGEEEEEKEEEEKTEENKEQK